MKDKTIRDLILLCRNHGLEDLSERILTVCDSVIFGSANSDRAWTEIEEIADIIQEKIEDAKIPIDEDQLCLLNPSFNVES